MKHVLTRIKEYFLYVIEYIFLCLYITLTVLFHSLALLIRSFLTMCFPEESYILFHKILDKVGIFFFEFWDSFVESIVSLYRRYPASRGEIIILLLRILPDFIYLMTTNPPYLIFVTLYWFLGINFIRMWKQRKADQQDNDDDYDDYDY